MTTICFAADFDALDLHDGARGPERAARQLVRRNNAVRFLHALHQFDDRGVEVLAAADAAQDRVNHARRTVDVKTVFHQTVDNLLDLRLRGALLHDDEHVPGSVLCVRHPVLLDAAHFVDDALENALQPVRRQRTVVVRVDVIENLSLPVGLVDRQRGGPLRAADLFDDRGSLVEQVDQTAIEPVDPLAAIGQTAARSASCSGCGDVGIRRYPR